MSQVRECPDCDGTGEVATACESCEGRGNVEGINCVDCGGDGEVYETCETCGGDGEIPDNRGGHADDEEEE